MGLPIDDGKGRGNSAGVDEEGRISTISTTLPLAHYINHSKGNVYSTGCLITPTGAGDCFFYIKNNSDQDMILDTVVLACAADEYISLYLGDTGTPAGGTATTPINRNTSSGNLADGAFQYGANITGLSGGSSALTLFIKGGESSEIFESAAGFIIAKNKVATIKCTIGAIQILMGLVISFHNKIG